MKDSFKSIHLIVATLILVGAGFVFLILTLDRVDRYLNDRARDECAKTRVYKKTVSQENITVSYPIEDLYRECLAEKGIDK